MSAFMNGMCCNNIVYFLGKEEYAMSEEKRKSAEDKGYTDQIYEVRFLPLMDREEYQNGPVRECLETLKKSMGEADFNKYVNQLIKITYDGSRLLMITKVEMHRPLLTTMYYHMICEAFHVDNFRVVSEVQGY